MAGIVQNVGNTSRWLTSIGLKLIGSASHLAAKNAAGYSIGNTWTPTERETRTS